MRKMTLSSGVLKALEIIQLNNGLGYVVGGCVRDFLLGAFAHDYDITTSLLPEETENAFKDYKRIDNNGKNHGTITVVIDKEVIEITTFRNDVNCDGRHAAVRFSKSLSDDVRRRDFTINALAYNNAEGVIDLVGGIKDLEKKIIRTVGNPEDRFKEDYLRILRALRFSSRLSFKIEDETKKAIFNNYKNLDKLSKERVLSELNGILVGENVLNILLEYKEVFCFLINELTDMVSFDHMSIYHRHDVYTHTAYVVSYTKPDFETRLAGLLHDIGKPNCAVLGADGYRHYPNHPLESYRLAKTILKKLGVSNKVYNNVLYLVLYHDETIKENVVDVKRILSLTPGNSFELFSKLIDLKKADYKDHINLDRLDIPNLDNIYNIARNIIETNNPYRISDLAINGTDLMDMGINGIDVRYSLEFLIEEVILNRVSNNKEDLIKHLINKRIKK